jgi:putative nucleotidyltransferase with HDIG domain
MGSPVGSEKSLDLALSPPKCDVVVVDDDFSSRNVLAAILEQAGVHCAVATSAAECLSLLDQQPFDVVISDLQMREMSGMALLERVRQRYPRIAFLMVTGSEDVRVGIQAMLQGADDYLLKPLQMDLVLFSLHRALQKKQMEGEIDAYRRRLETIVAERTEQLRDALQQLENSYQHTLEALGQAIDLRDNQTAGHSRRVCLYSVRLVREMGGTDEQVRSVAMGAWLHDIGKLAIPDAILLKPGRLTEDEWRVMRSHVMLGYEMVRKIPFLAEAAEIVLMHHERCDGSGYPRGLKAHEIPFGARIFALADTVDAMTSDRPYRRAMSWQAAREQVEQGSGTQYDAQIVEVFLKIPIEEWERTRQESMLMTGLGR